jgi:hypothetical protein
VVDEVQLPTPEEIARHYAALKDSVALIDAGSTDADAIARNVLHLEQMLANPWWDGYDMTAVEAAIAKGKQP